MTYNPGIPNSNDLLSVSQGQIKNNFSSANTSFGIDHYPFDDQTANNGKHKKVTLPVVGLPVSIDGETIIWGSTQGDPPQPTQLFYTRDASGTAIAINGKIDPIAVANKGCTSLIGNILLQWGQTTANSSGVFSTTFAKPFTPVFQAVVSSSNAGAFAIIGTLDNTHVSGTTGPNAVVRYFAIGLKTDTV